MSVFNTNWWYSVKCLLLVFVVAPAIMSSCGVIICAAVECWKRMQMPRCSKCLYFGTVQCPMYGRNDPDDYCSKGKKW